MHFLVNHPNAVVAADLSRARHINEARQNLLPSTHALTERYLMPSMASWKGVSRIHCPLDFKVSCCPRRGCFNCRAAATSLQLLHSWACCWTFWQHALVKPFLQPCFQSANVELQVSACQSLLSLQGSCRTQQQSSCMPNVCLADCSAANASACRASAHGLILSQDSQEISKCSLAAGSHFWLPVDSESVDRAGLRLRTKPLAWQDVRPAWIYSRAFCLPI